MIVSKYSGKVLFKDLSLDSDFLESYRITSFIKRELPGRVEFRFTITHHIQYGRSCDYIAEVDVKDGSPGVGTYSYHEQDKSYTGSIFNIIYSESDVDLVIEGVWVEGGLRYPMRIEVKRTSSENVDESELL